MTSLTSLAFTKVQRHLHQYQPTTLLAPRQEGDTVKLEANALLDKVAAEFGINAQETNKGWWDQDAGEFSLRPALMTGLRFIQDLAVNDEHRTSVLLTIADK